MFALRALRNAGNDSSVDASAENRGSDARPVQATLPLALAHLRSVTEAATLPRPLQVRVSERSGPQEALRMESRGQRRRLQEVLRAAKERGGVSLTKAQARRMAKKLPEPDAKKDKSSSGQSKKDFRPLGDRLSEVLGLRFPKLITV